MHTPNFKVKQQFRALKLNPGTLCPPTPGNLPGFRTPGQIGLKMEVTFKLIQPLHTTKANKPTPPKLFLFSAPVVTKLLSNLIDTLLEPIQSDSQLYSLLPANKQVT